MFEVGKASASALARSLRWQCRMGTRGALRPAEGDVSGPRAPSPRGCAEEADGRSSSVLSSLPALGHIRLPSAPGATNLIHGTGPSLGLEDSSLGHDLALYFLRFRSHLRSHCLQKNFSAPRPRWPWELKFPPIFSSPTWVLVHGCVHFVEMSEVAHL